MAARSQRRRSKRQRHRDATDDDDGDEFSAAFANVPVPHDILQRRAVDQDAVEAEIAARDSEVRAERNATGDAGGQNGDPLFVVFRDNRRNLDNLSGAGREAHRARLSEMLQEAEALNLGDDDGDEGRHGVPMAEDEDDNSDSSEGIPMAYDVNNEDSSDEDEQEQQQQQLLLAEDDGDDDEGDDDDEQEQGQGQLLAEDGDNEDDDEEQETTEGNEDDLVGDIEDDENRITLQDVRDGFVGTGTKGSYLNVIIVFIRWCRVNQPTWVTTFCKDQMTDIKQRADGLA